MVVAESAVTGMLGVIPNPRGMKGRHGELVSLALLLPLLLLLQE